VRKGANFAGFRVEGSRLCSGRFMVGVLIGGGLKSCSNVYPYDEHLVRLRDGGYINASRVQVAGGGGGQGTYVVASAPMHPDMHGPDTTAAFWRLIWEQNVQIVVMLALVLVGRRSL